MTAIVTKEIASKIFESVIELGTEATLTMDMWAATLKLWPPPERWGEEVGQIIQDAAQLLTDEEFERFEDRLFQIIDIDIEPS